MTEARDSSTVHPAHQGAAAARRGHPQNTTRNCYEGAAYRHIGDTAVNTSASPRGRFSPRNTVVDVEVIEVAFWKWPHVRHYHHHLRLLGEDENAVWGVCEAGEHVRRGGAFAFVRPHDYLMAIPRVGCWSALWYPPDDLDREVYVNVNSSPVWTGDHVDIIDLDFDLLRMRDGSVNILGSPRTSVGR